MISLPSLLKCKLLILLGCFSEFSTTDSGNMYAKLSLRNSALQTGFVRQLFRTTYPAIFSELTNECP